MNLRKKDELRFKKICSDYKYIPSIIKNKRRIIGIGDIHGDLKLAINFLIVGKLIQEFTGDNREYNFINYIEPNLTFKVPIFSDSNDFKKIYNKMSDIILISDCRMNIKRFRYFRWIGEDTYVVQVGDQIDRCRPQNNINCENENITFEDENSDLLIMELFDSLHKIAKIKKGAVYSLIGNHEVMNFEGNFDYVSNKGITEYNINDNIKNIKDIKKDRLNFFNNMRKKFACTRNSVIIIGDFVFVHGGLVGSLLSKYNIFDINHIIRTYIYNKFDTLKKYIRIIEKKNNNTKLEKLNNKLKEYNKIINSENISPLWYRKLARIVPDEKNKDLSHNTKKKCVKYLDPVTEHFKKNGIELKGLIIGHTPQFALHNLGINTACNEKIIRIDIGASRAFNNILSDKHLEQRQPQVIEILTFKNSYSMTILK